MIHCNALSKNRKTPFSVKTCGPWDRPNQSALTERQNKIKHEAFDGAKQGCIRRTRCRRQTRRCFCFSVLVLRPEQTIVGGIRERSEGVSIATDLKDRLHQYRGLPTQAKGILNHCIQKSDGKTRGTSKDLRWSHKPRCSGSSPGETKVFEERETKLVGWKLGRKQKFQCRRKKKTWHVLSSLRSRH